ncbi:MAG: hypothetical protein M3M85_01030 [bacterium]|nr:hypothetical protein [bacterium]
MKEGTNFLDRKFPDLTGSKPVERAIKKVKRKGEKAPNKRPERIEAYLDRLKSIISPEAESHSNFSRKERNLRLLKTMLHDNFVIKPEEIPEAYFENQRRIQREQGKGNAELTQYRREQLAEAMISDQQTSLDKWVDYLASPDAKYPDWLKYYGIRNILGLGGYNKEEKTFSKRSRGTVSPFPDLDRAALSYVLDILEKKVKGEGIDLSKLESSDKERFEKLLAAENFGKLYVWAIEKETPGSKEFDLENVQGEWVKYRKGSDHMPLVKSIQGRATGWCTVGESIAKAQLSEGDFYVYYSLDNNDRALIPRAAIRMDGEEIAELRGIGVEQNLDPYIGEVVQSKLKEFPHAAEYEKKSSDMKRLTDIESKHKAGQELSKDDLIFLYEIDAEIEGFGYDKDPRIREIRSQRNSNHDMLIVFECEESQIARDANDIKQGIKAYIGPLTPGIFMKIQEHGVEHIYASFPEEHIRKDKMLVGGKKPKELFDDLTKKGVLRKKKSYFASDFLTDFLHRGEFTTVEKPQSVEFVRFRVASLGYSTLDPKDRNSSMSMKELLEHAHDLGLKLCSIEAGLYYRDKYRNQPVTVTDHINNAYVCTEPIMNEDGKSVFLNLVNNYGGGLGIEEGWGLLYPNDEVIFILSQVSNKDSVEPKS